MSEYTDIQPNPEVSLWIIGMLANVIRQTANGTLTDYDAARMLIGIADEAFKRNGTIRQ